MENSARSKAFIKLHCVVRLDQEAILLFLDEATDSGNVWRILKEAGIEVFRKKADIRPDTLPERLLHAFKGAAFPLEFSVAG